MSVIHKSRVATVTTLVVGAFVACIVPLAAIAAPTVDGKIDLGEYALSETYDVSFTMAPDPNKNLPGGTNVPGGKLLINVAANGDVYVAFSQPKDLVDNSYGTNAVGWINGHKFKELRDSDKAMFLFTDSSGDQIVDIQLDYLYETEKNKSGVFGAGMGTGSEGKVEDDANLWTDAIVLESSSSMDYNINAKGYSALAGEGLSSPKTTTVNGDPYVLDGDGTAYAGWLFDVIYEMKIDGEVFEAAGGFQPSMLAIGVVHDSPNKKGKKEVYTTITTHTPTVPPPGGAVPEPMTMLALMAGVSGLGGYLRKRIGRTA